MTTLVRHRGWLALTTTYARRCVLLAGTGQGSGPGVALRQAPQFLTFLRGVKSRLRAKRRGPGHAEPRHTVGDEEDVAYEAHDVEEEELEELEIEGGEQEDAGEDSRPPSGREPSEDGSSEDEEEAQAQRPVTGSLVRPERLQTPQAPGAFIRRRASSSHEQSNRDAERRREW